MRYLLNIFLIILVFSSLNCGKKEKAAIEIGKIKITSSEFEKAYKNSRFSKSKEDKRDMFLDSYITKLILLKEAEEMGLDKDPLFLASVQRFWEQGLLKLILKNKSEEFSSKINVSNDEILEYYNKYKNSEFKDKSLSEVSARIKWLISKEKERKEILSWTKSLKKKTNFMVDRKLLGIEK